MPKTDRAVVLAAIAIIVFLVLQPAFVSRDRFRQSKFSWEMYSKSAPRDEFLVSTATGIERVAVTDVQPRGLASVDYTTVLPAFICESRPDVVDIATYRADELIGTHSCER